MIIFGVHWRHTSLHFTFSSRDFEILMQIWFVAAENFALIAKLKKENEILKFESFNCHVELELC